MIYNYQDHLVVEMTDCSAHPDSKVLLAAEHCMKNLPIGYGIEDTSRKKASNLVSFLLQSKHGNPLEHVNYTFQVHNLSRSCQLQLVRHRTATYTFTSQQYQDHSDYNFMYDKKQFEKLSDSMKEKIFDQQVSLLRLYNDLIDLGWPRDEARQVLPNAVSSNCIWTINARNLVHFLNLRLCRRNSQEILHLARTVHALVKEHFPALFNQVHATCAMQGACDQGHMSCGRPYGEVK